MNHRLMNVVQQDIPATCPFYKSSICRFDRTSECATSPWLRVSLPSRKLNKQYCIYEFSEETLKSVNH